MKEDSSESCLWLWLLADLAVGAGDLEKERMLVEGRLEDRSGREEMAGRQ